VSAGRPVGTGKIDPSEFVRMWMGKASAREISDIAAEQSK